MNSNDNIDLVENDNVEFVAFRRIGLVGDSYGIAALLKHVPIQTVVCFIAAAIRPQYLDELRAVAQAKDRPLLIQPRMSNASLAQKFIGEFRTFRCESLICCSYSMKLPLPILEAVRRNALNIHASLLPKNRGPNPIQWAIIRGESSTGVTAHQMVDRIDAGPIMEQVRVEIGLLDTWVSLRDRISEATEALLERAVPRVLEGGAVCVPQIEAEATVNSRLTPESPRIDLQSMSDKQIYDLIRAQVSPLSGAFLEDNQGRRFYFKSFVSLDRIPLIRQSFLRGGLKGLTLASGQ